MSHEIAIYCFTDRGQALGQHLCSLLEGGQIGQAGLERVTDLKASAEAGFAGSRVMVFIGAAGIAVRAVAPLLQAKGSDPAVIVIDEAGQFVIPLLSGHLGGANRIARRIAGLLAAQAVVTTATDVNQVFSFDAFAEAAGLAVVNPPAIKAVAAAMLAGKAVGLACDWPVAGELPELVELADQGELGVYIGFDLGCRPFRQTLALVPRLAHVGIGARKGIPVEALERFYSKALAAAKLPPQAVAAVASIDLKQSEPAILELARRHGLPFHTYSDAELGPAASRFQQSERVLAATGVGNVSEAAAFTSASVAAGLPTGGQDSADSGPGGSTGSPAVASLAGSPATASLPGSLAAASPGVEMAYPRHAQDGMTIAIAIAPWQLCFDDEQGVCT